jgi:SNF2 family DNA or RNA helicase
MVQACLNLEEEKDYIKEDYNTFRIRIGVIGDLVGSGKTLSALSIIASKPHIERIHQTNQSSSYGLVNTSRHITPKTIPVNLIVVPHTLIKQWESYIKKNTNINFLVMSTSKQCTEVVTKLKEDTEYDYPIILLSSTRYSNFSYNMKFSQISFSRIFFDEIDTINLPNNQCVSASFYWFITSTYDNLYYPHGRRFYTNNLGEMSPYKYSTAEYSIFNQITGINNIGFIKTIFLELKQTPSCIVQKIFIKNDHHFVAESFHLPSYNISILPCEAPKIIRVLNGIIPNKVLESINAGDIQSALDAFTCIKISPGSNIIDIFTKELQLELDNTQLLLDMTQKMNHTTSEIKETALEPILKKISEINSKMLSIKERVEEEELCPICYDPPDTLTITKCCNHKFCFECLTQSITGSTNNANKKECCPYCRSVMTTDDIIVVTNTSCGGGGGKGDDISEDKRDKLWNINKLITSIFNGDHKKVLIFSNYYNSFIEIESILNTLGIINKRVMGSSSSINNIIQRYKDPNDSLNVLFLNSHYAGSGINLENTTDIILYHNINKELTTQVIGRAQRPGRTGSLNIHRLVYPNEIDMLCEINN